MKIASLQKNNRKQPFFPYENKVRKAYFIYFGIFCFFGFLVYLFSLFLIINLAKNNKFHITSNFSDLNFFFTPILSLFLVTISWFLLVFAPKKIYKNPKHSSVMFYFSFWFLIVSVLLNSQLQLEYIEKYANDWFFHWLNVTFAKFVIILLTFSLLPVQVFFWIMRRKFAFMPTDYEIYLARAAKKSDKKAMKILKKENAKLINKKS